MSTPTSIEPRIKDFIAQNLLFSAEGFTYSDDASFLQEGIIDSLGVMELVEFVQKEFGIPVAQAEVTPEHFDSVVRLAAFVRRKQTLQPQ
jgi:acyl carrier protein